MTRKNAETGTITRQQLNDVYMYVVNNWAVYAEDIALAEAIHVKDVNKALRKLERTGLLAGQKINAERRLTWQSHYDIENSIASETCASAQADFDKAFPADAKKAPAKKSGSTGPRYSDKQINAGLKARKAGKPNKQVAEAAGVKSPSYFAKVLKAVEAERQAQIARTRKDGIGR